MAGAGLACLWLACTWFGLYLRRLGHQDLQHAVLGRGLDRVRHDMGGQSDRAEEAAVAALDSMDHFLGGVVRVVPLALDRQ